VKHFPNAMHAMLTATDETQCPLLRNVPSKSSQAIMDG